MPHFYETTRLGPRQSTTPEGYLVCHDVPIARTGEQRYHYTEVTEPDHPIVGDADGWVTTDRPPEEVFRPETMASFNGKPVTIDHPDTLVNPDNDGELRMGHLQNVRRGTGVEDDLLFADLVITRREAIDAVRKGLREVSCGYEALYHQDAPGRAVQREILGNHLALVPRGRCGPRCAIGDSHKEANTMTTQTQTSTPTNAGSGPKPKRKGVADKLRGLLTFLDGDDDDDGDETDEEKEKKKTADAIAKAVRAAVKDAMAPVMDAIKALDEDMEELKKAKTDDGGDLTDPETAEHNTDALGEAWTGDSLEVTLQRAEILAPGGPRFTADGKTKKVGDAVCACQRAALKRAATADATKDAIAPLLVGVDLEKATYDTLRPLFVAGTEIVKAKNAPRVHGMTHDSAQGGAGTGGKPLTVVDAQKANDDFWAARRGS